MRASIVFDRLSKRAARAAGHADAFIVAVLAILVWSATGPMFRFSDTWQLVINTATTIVTFLIVFLFKALRTATAKQCN